LWSPDRTVRGTTPKESLRTNPCKERRPGIQGGADTDTRKRALKDLACSSVPKHKSRPRGDLALQDVSKGESSKSDDGNLSEGSPLA